ncbi:TadE/TadG family type IV pilus assembly protein [Amaricoccus sp.]|uniref:TadE/TadG family type IV pilus assembly protein n=1 Tax=Amaricoccus sp. TaxID=1872485 RepID=UPI00260B4E7A|nr:TadE/TadG family type IV pilus assembly protein [Amaricoccus sp.]HRO12219.1 TadE/TadG family type IV pilus assembly protein [Amaricoccus sp.]
MSRRLRALAGETGGATAVEFSLVLPLLLLFIVGSIESAIVLFIGSSIEAAVMEASRYGITGTEAGVSRADRVMEIVEDRTYGLLDMDQVDMEILVYQSFADIGKPEPFTDQNGNATYEAGEPFTDVNGNGEWDDDMGEAGLGGPSDVVVYRLSYAWGVITPLMRRILGESVTHVSSVAVRNEPY